MKSILYVSVADPALDSESVLALIDDCGARNGRDRITGFLLYNGSNFMQLIEGDDDVVNACFARIAADERHSGVCTIREQALAIREYPAWSMRYSFYAQPTQAIFDELVGAGAPTSDTVNRISAFIGLGRRGH